MSVSTLLVLPAGPANAATERVCAGDDNVPQGFVKVNDYWDPTRCGNPSSIFPNVWVIESYTDKAVGDEMVVCSGWRPAGWSTLNSFWDPTRCGNPGPITNNMWSIKRLV
ncbi:hypothetical protein ETD83_25150 [Actinomadura soli]|uniref:Uncharacterized protein n=1 Tax=Actinomadura soli TaxID=2508997 RepID=A0A5C4J735_9ACTN|nr:hypothetical protein [Actinomadura soli]TMQ93566.1 hypothetical protein ETD83_25150 [Actinomadura soli]